jgi:hypothetical protein
MRPQAGGSSAIDGAAVSLMHADEYFMQTSVNGAGVGIAVMSDDATSLAAIQAWGELPAVEVLQPGPSPSPNPNPTDEGTMMLEEVYAVAPGASLYFCGALTSVEYLGCLQNAVSAGVNIVSDDLGIPTDDLMSANGACSIHSRE